MSHFTVLVIDPDYQQALIPFQEHACTGECPEQYLEFIDHESEYLVEYDTESRNMKKLPTGEFVSKWDERFKVGGSIGWSSNDKYSFPDGTEDVSVPFKELYSTFEEFAYDYHGFKNRDEKTGRYGYWENPNKKWDWYQVGGRWGGWMKLKSGARGMNGQRSWANPGSNENGTCDQAYNRDIDWEVMIEVKRQEAGSVFDKIWPLVKDVDFKPWSYFVDQVEAKMITWDEARAAYHDQPVLKAVNEVMGDSWYGWGDQIAAVIASKGDRDLYVTKTSRENSTTWAMIYNGEWIEKGKMGWWAANDATDESKKSYTDRFWEIINSLPDDATVTLVDCHI